MNDINALNEVAIQKNAIRDEKHLALLSYVEKTIASLIPATLAPYAKMCNVDAEHAEIEVTDENNKHRHTFDLYFYKHWASNEVRHVSMNFGCFGSFTSNDVASVKYCELLGVFASSLSELEQKLLFSNEGKKAFAEYWSAFAESWKVNDVLRSAIAEQKAKEHDAKKAEIAKNILPGTKVMCGKKYGQPIIEEIDSVMPKNITFKSRYGRVKKDVLIENIINEKWSFIESDAVLS